MACLLGQMTHAPRRHGSGPCVNERQRAPESGKDTPTPWVRSDVLALIARRGLGVSPHEVEL